MDLDSTIWSKARNDILYRLIELSDRSTQIKWAGTDRKFRHFCVPEIWHTLRLFANDFDHHAGLVNGPDDYRTLKFWRQEAIAGSNLTRELIYSYITSLSHQP